MKRILMMLTLFLLAVPITLFASPTPTPTCAPCMAEISIYDVSVSDEFGECFDGDNLVDIGEVVGFTVSGRSMDSCCWGPGSRSITASTTYPYFEYMGYESVGTPGAMSFHYRFYFEVMAGAECMDEAVVQFDAYVRDDYWYDEDHETHTYTIEVDSDGQGGYVCDTWPCDGAELPTSTPTPPPTSTPTADVGVDLGLNRTEFRSGDPFLLTAAFTNTGSESMQDLNFILLLDVASQYFWYPGWSSAYDCLNRDLEPGTETRVILDFIWPDTPSKFSGAIFHGALLNSSHTEIVGQTDSVAFGWE